MNIILFDGECHFCDATVQFIMKRDHKKHFKFASIQSDIGQTLMEKFHVPKSIDSVIYIEGDNCYFKSTAVLRISRKLDRGWKGFYLFTIIPTPIRDLIYDKIAKNRHKLIKNNQCSIPKKDDLDRFLQ
ncbi:DUF393 domain-containing protein [Lysinibacillus halotolerans]|uniref:DUF393 domain-containing protein n=1 Tax=Lysinibacillus halotolerans TaxID=1368476 RepID=A0A3M8H4W2_9BACI|nr:DUF393 domain-containing protein [Lysinibacillus halotolerans]RNC97451.1 DUF393 domain-containing protein [Lysinibacillus halotolerans]